MTPPVLLIVEDDIDAAESLARNLSLHRRDKWRVVTANTESAAQIIIKRDDPPIVILDLCIDTSRGVESGFSLITWCVSKAPTTRVVVLTGHGSAQNGVRAMELGAAAFIEKPANLPHLLAIVTEAFEQSQVRRKLNQVSIPFEAELLKSFVGSSNAALKVREQIAFAGFSPQSVLILGETGTGKGLCARLIHRLGARGKGPFVRFQPTFTAADLVASELFGHIKGAFTGALQQRDGLLREAANGTFFLDEVDALLHPMQVLLLGALQDKKFRPVGANKEVESNFRLICASNQDESVLSQGSTLRRDFYHRIAGLIIRLPALRERSEDIPEIILSLLLSLRNESGVKVYGIDPKVMEQLVNYSWPGNVRELVSVVEGAVYQAAYRRSESVRMDHLELPKINNSLKKIEIGFRGTFMQKGVSLADQVRAFKRQVVAEALALEHGNQMGAARLLSIDRSTLRRIISE
jgi:DNA-binding NtrC family response regulator